MKQNQGSEPAGRTPLASYKCPICMDTPEDATTTTCGELSPFSLGWQEMTDMVSRSSVLPQVHHRYTTME